MANANSIIEPEYRVNVYLDTNILVDYVEKTYPLLNKSIDFLAQCPFVNLRSSHYVLFEFTEVRKLRLFWAKADPVQADAYENVKNTIKKTWEYKGNVYDDFKAEITSTVSQELNYIKNSLQLNFDEHVLHEGLVYPTNSLCLATNISKEDCLVMVSCMYPEKNALLDHCLLLSRDSQYFKAYTDNRADSDKVFEENNLNSPSLIRTEDLRINERGTQYNLYNNDGRTDIEKYWIWLITATLKKNHASQYVGMTYKHGREEEAKKCIYFEMDGADKQLRESAGLYFVFNDLSQRIILSGPFEFWNIQRIELPHTNPVLPRYSFKMEGLDPNMLIKLRENGNCVFYYDI